MAKIKTIPCDPYRRDIDVFIGSHEELLKYANKHLKDDCLLDIIKNVNPDDYDASFYYRGDGTGIVHIYKMPTTPVEISVAGHEVLHATFHVLNYCGVEYQVNGSNEAFTYLHQWILQNVLDKKGYKRV